MNCFYIPYFFHFMKEYYNFDYIIFEFISFRRIELLISLSYSFFVWDFQNFIAFKTLFFWNKFEILTKPISFYCFLFINSFITSNYFLFYSFITTFNALIITLLPLSLLYSLNLLSLFSYSLIAIADYFI
jgi:hypothetical protein